MTDREPEFRWLDYKNLSFDPHNPRFPRSVDGHDTSDVISFMIEDAGLVDLIRSIASQGFFPGEPLLVAPDARNSDRAVVVEGNRRLAAVTLINEPTRTTKRRTAIDAAVRLGGDQDLRRLPCLVFDDRASILAYLGYRHVTGIKEWSPLAKARFLKQRYEAVADTTREEALKQVARSIGSRSDYVARLLTASALFDHIETRGYFSVPGLSESTIEFSLISSLLAYSAIVKFLGLSSSGDFEMTELRDENLAFLVRFVFERDGDGQTRLRESRNIGRFAEVISNDRASSALMDGASLNRASQLMGTSSDTLETLINSALESLSLALANAEGVEITSGSLDRISKIISVASQLKQFVSVRG